MKELEEKLKVGAKIRIGRQYAELIGGFDEGEIIELIEGYFEHDNGLYTETHMCPAISDGNDDFDSIYHLFGNELEDFLDCEIVL